MKKTELVAEITKKIGGGKFTAEVIDEFLNFIVAAVASGETVEIYNFGKFYPFKVKAHLANNPQKPDEKIQVPEKTVPKFKAAGLFKNFVNGEIDKNGVD